MYKAPSVPEQARQRRVSFAMDPNDQMEVNVQVKLIDTSLGTDEKKKLFWTKKENRRIRRSAWAVINQVNAQDRCNSFNYQMGHVQHYEFDYCPILLRAFDSCHKNSEELTEEERYALTEWMVYGDDRRGLERNCIAQLNESLAKRKKRAINVVLMMHGSVVPRGYLSADQEEIIARVYRNFSAQSQRFAELMGQVDEGAVVKAGAAKEDDKENGSTG